MNWYKNIISSTKLNFCVTCIRGWEGVIANDITELAQTIENGEEIYRNDFYAIAEIDPEIKKKIDIALIGFNDDQNKFDVLTTGTLYIDETTNLRERLGEINNYENVLLFDYLRSLTDPKDELRREIEAYGFKESQDFTYPNIGPVRVFVKSQSLIGISF